MAIHGGFKDQDQDQELINNSSSSLNSNSPITTASQNLSKNQHRRANEVDDGDTVVEQGVEVKKSVGTKRAIAKSLGNNCNNGDNKEGRWAEHLLNPCAIAITAGNLTRVQHLLYVLHELASSTSDANHRLSDHGLRALTHHLLCFSRGHYFCFHWTKFF
ncbi:unnamed protein product [Ilex paraguariensis]|uniref:Uncharacterized protein n=1 Tax=Ilex paraguariensis TaxID=185542 RepID=A0ABC8S0L3_9AQUA